MYVRHLSLSDFRNYRDLELTPPAGPLLFIGENAQGKTNLLEAVYLLSTIRSLRAGSDSELIRWEAAQEGPAVARLVAEAERSSGPVRVEMVIQGQPEDSAPASEGRSRAGKRLRVNGVPKRASETIGRINAVLFTSQDIDLIGGPPSLRRRYLDITLTQVDARYLASLQQYTKVLSQRNALLRRIQSGMARREELAFWDEHLARAGSYLVSARSGTVARLAGLAAEAHSFLSQRREALTLTYQPRWADGWDEERAGNAGQEELATAFLQTLLRGREREVAAGASLWGPHRDDLLFLLDGRSAAAFASRAQRRTAALALRLAEAQFLLTNTGDRPVLLLDDVLSEMDTGRRAGVLDVISGFDQVWITSAEREEEGQRLIPGASVFSVKAGQVLPARDG
jgi:DNA replication and repair protein RecF